MIKETYIKMTKIWKYFVKEECGNCTKEINKKFNQKIIFKNLKIKNQIQELWIYSF